MAMEQLRFRVAQNDLSAVDDLAKEHKTTKSEYVRNILEQYMSDKDKLGLMFYRLATGAVISSESNTKQTSYYVPTEVRDSLRSVSAIVKVGIDVMVGHIIRDHIENERLVK